MNTQSDSNKFFFSYYIIFLSRFVVSEYIQRKNNIQVCRYNIKCIIFFVKNKKKKKNNSYLFELNVDLIKNFID